MKLVGLGRTRALRWRWPWRRTSELSLQERNVRYFCTDTACQGLILGGISAFISVFVVRLGASSFLVSLLTALPAIAGAVLSVPLSGYIERQRNLIRFTNWWRLPHRLSFLLVALLPFFLHRGVAEAVVVVWGLSSIPAAVINLAWTAAVADIIPPKERPAVNGRRWAMLSLVTAISVAMFGYILERLPSPLNYQTVFIVSFLGALVSMYFWSLIRLLPTQEGDPAAVSPSPATAAGLAAPPAGALPKQSLPLLQRLQRYIRPLTESPVFVRYLLTTFVLRLGLNLPVALYSIYWVRHLDASDLWIGWRTTASSLALIVGYYLWGKIASRKGHHLVLITCSLGMGAYPMLTALISTQVLLPLVALVHGFFVTGIDLAFFDTLLHVCPAKKRASYIALNILFADLAISVAPMLGSLLTRWLDIRTVFFIAGGIHVLAIVLFRIFRVAMEE